MHKQTDGWIVDDDGDGSTEKLAELFIVCLSSIISGDDELLLAACVSKHTLQNVCTFYKQKENLFRSMLVVRSTARASGPTLAATSGRVVVRPDVHIT